jgi:hypothetical protein
MSAVQNDNSGMNFQLWSHFSEDAAKVKDKLWTISAWLFSLLGGILAFIGQNLSENQVAFKNPNTIVLVAISGLVLSCYTWWMIYENGKHLRIAWDRTNYLRSKMPQVEMAWQAGKEANNGQNGTDTGMPPFVNRLLWLCLLFSGVFVAILVFIVSQNLSNQPYDYQTEIRKTMNLNLDVASVIGAILWPVIILVILFSKRFSALLEALLNRITKVEIAGITLELPPAASTAIQEKEELAFWQKVDSFEINASSPPAFIKHLTDGKQADYITLDLGTGESWLTSRIFFISILYYQIKGVKAIVFTETVNGGTKKYLGWISSEKIRWLLAKKYKWLEVEYQKSYSASLANSRIISSSGMLDDYQHMPASQELLRLFLVSIQKPAKTASDINDEWVQLKKTDSNWERAHWVNNDLLQQIAGDEMCRDYVRHSELRLKTDMEKARIIAGFKGQYVAVVFDDGRLDYLVDRQKLLEQLAVQSLKA